MADSKPELLQGTLDLLILKTLALGALHGWAISKRIRQMSRDELTVTRLTHPGARAWALVADEVYRTVLALLAVATSRPLPTEEYTLGREAIAWMHALSAVAQRLVTLPAGTGDLRAGPSFSLPFTLAIPDPASARTAWVGGVLLGLDANLREIARGSLPEEAAELVARLRDGVRATLSALSLPVPKVES